MISVPEAARRTGKNAETIRRWIRVGRLRSEKVGTQHMIHEEDLEAMLDDDAPLRLPKAWMLGDNGQAMPAWEQLVRDGRDAH